ncbi:MAG: hypothetical protein R2705_18570 [Ilumatobacteraceae bacterium]
MTAGELAVLLAAVLCTIGFAGLVVVLLRVLDSTKALGGQVEGLHREVERSATRPDRSGRAADTVDDAESIWTASIECSDPPRRSAARWLSVATASPRLR